MGEAPLFRAPTKKSGLKRILFRLVGEIEMLMKDLNVSSSLSELGFDESDLRRFAENALKLRRLIDLCRSPLRKYLGILSNIL